MREVVEAGDEALESVGAEEFAELLEGGADAFELPLGRLLLEGLAAHLEGEVERLRLVLRQLHEQRRHHLAVRLVQHREQLRRPLAHRRRRQRAAAALGVAGEHRLQLRPQRLAVARDEQRRQPVPRGERTLAHRSHHLRHRHAHVPRLLAARRQKRQRGHAGAGAGAPAYESARSQRSARRSRISDSRARGTPAASPSPRAMPCSRARPRARDVPTPQQRVSLAVGAPESDVRAELVQRALLRRRRARGVGGEGFDLGVDFRQCLEPSGLVAARHQPARALLLEAVAEEGALLADVERGAELLVHGLQRRQRRLRRPEVALRARARAPPPRTSRRSSAARPSAVPRRGRGAACSTRLRAPRTPYARSPRASAAAPPPRHPTPPRRDALSDGSRRRHAPSSLVSASPRPTAPSLSSSVARRGPRGTRRPRALRRRSGGPRARRAAAPSPAGAASTNARRRPPPRAARARARPRCRRAAPRRRRRRRRPPGGRAAAAGRGRRAAARQRLARPRAPRPRRVATRPQPAPSPAVSGVRRRTSASSVPSHSESSPASAPRASSHSRRPVASSAAAAFAPLTSQRRTHGARASFSQPAPAAAIVSSVSAWSSSHWASCRRHAIRPRCASCTSHQERRRAGGEGGSYFGSASSASPRASAESVTELRRRDELLREPAHDVLVGEGAVELGELHPHLLLAARRRSHVGGAARAAALAAAGVGGGGGAE